MYVNNEEVQIIFNVFHEQSKMVSSATFGLLCIWNNKVI